MSDVQLWPELGQKVEIVVSTLRGGEVISGELLEAAETGWRLRDTIIKPPTEPDAEPTEEDVVIFVPSAHVLSVAWPAIKVKG